MSVARVTSPAWSGALHTGSRVPHPMASERALAIAVAAALDGVCEVSISGDVVFSSVF